MKEAVIKLLTLFLVFTLSADLVFAKNNVKMITDANFNFTIKNKELPDELIFNTPEDINISDVIFIPKQALLTLEVIKAQRELRWHKGGLILCKLKSYTPETSEDTVNLSDKDIYLIIRKYEKLNKKEAFILGTEIVVFQGASFFAPGVDIGYFFIKGAIQREKHPNWFKAGVHNAYDNSIFWFPQKGKPIELKVGDSVKIKSIKKSKAEKLITKIDKRNMRFERQALQRIAKKDKRILKKEYKNEKNMIDCSVVEAVIENVVVDRSVLAEIYDTQNNDANRQ